MSKKNQERITNDDISALYQSLAQKDEQMHKIISETESGVNDTNSQIYT